MKLSRFVITGYILSITAAATMMCVVPLLIMAQNQAGSTPACLKVSRFFRMILVGG
jgi:hypothetical protein